VPATGQQARQRFRLRPNRFFVRFNQMVAVKRKRGG
jgi:hypothetical protein